MAPIDQSSANHDATTSVAGDANEREESTQGETPATRTPESDSNRENETQKQKSGTENASKDDSRDGSLEKKEEQAEQPEPERSRAKIAIIMFALGLAVFLAALDITIVTTAVPTIANDIGSTSIFAWIGSSYLLASAASTPVWGKISDIFGRKPILIVSNVIFFIGSLIAALAVDAAMLIVGRVIQGIGGGGLISLVSICIGDLFSPRRRGTYYGIIGAVWAIASSLGPIIGGAFTQEVSWRWCFYINLPLDGIALGILVFFLDIKTPRTPILAGLKAIDWLGGTFVVGGTVMFLLGLEFGGQSHPWASAIVICLFVFGVVVFIIFGVIEVYFAKYPIMPSRIFKNRSAVAALVTCFVQSFVFISGSYYLPLYFQASLGSSPLLSGVYLLPTSLSLSLSSMVTGIYIRKTGRYLPPIYAGMFLMCLGYGLFIDFDAHSSWAKIILYQIVAGIGVGPNFQAPLIALQNFINPQDIGVATSTFYFMRNLGTSVSIVIGGVVFQNQLAEKAKSVPALASGSGGEGGPGAAIGIVESLPPSQKGVAQETFADSLQAIWILYTVIAAVGVVNVVFIRRKMLATEHKETETGLEAQEKVRVEDQERKRVAKQEKADGKANGVKKEGSGGNGGGGLSGMFRRDKGEKEEEKMRDEEA
ncbi:MAG: hypothetical protein M1831_000442 [Alyxoria varia]|nr:MAG: hypothetical protein M1831_000442 [Alyxoria varia]